MFPSFSYTPTFYRSTQATLYTYFQVYKNIIFASECQSSDLCKSLYTSWDNKMDQHQVLRLPSMAKLNTGFIQCSQSFDHECVEPSGTNSEQSMMKVVNCILLFVLWAFFFCFFLSFSWILLNLELTSCVLSLWMFADVSEVTCTTRLFNWLVAFPYGMSVSGCLLGWEALGY